MFPLIQRCHASSACDFSPEQASRRFWEGISLFGRNPADIAQPIFDGKAISRVIALTKHSRVAGLEKILMDDPRRNKFDFSQCSCPLDVALNGQWYLDVQSNWARCTSKRRVNRSCGIRAVVANAIAGTASLSVIFARIMARATSSRSCSRAGVMHAPQ